MEDVIAKIDRELIEAELTPEHLLRHTNKLDNEIYIILEGEGHYTCNGETVSVKAGDVLVNPPFGTHALANDSGSDVEMRVLVLESYNR